MGHSNAYTLDLDSSWAEETLAAGDGVQYTNLSFAHWHGTSSNGAQRPVVRLLCPADVPCTDVDVSGFYVWTDAGSTVDWLCANAYGTGACVRDGASHTTYTTTATLTTVSGYQYTTMPGELSSGLGLTTSIAIPPVPTSFFPGLAPTSKLCSSGGC